MRLSKIVGILLITAFVFTVGQANASPPKIEKQEQVSLNITYPSFAIEVVNFEFAALQNVAVESNSVVKDCNANFAFLVNDKLIENTYISPHYRRCDKSINYVENLATSASNYNLRMRPGEANYDDSYLELKESIKSTLIIIQAPEIIDKK